MNARTLEETVDVVVDVVLETELEGELVVDDDRLVPVDVVSDCGWSGNS